LGDNIFYGSGLKEKLQQSTTPDGGIIFAYGVQDPERYGVVEFDKNYNAISLEEKPNRPKSNFAIPGIYFYDNEVVSIAKQIKPSPRGELEITDINKVYLQKKKLQVKTLDRGTAWLDTGTFSSLMQAAQFVQVMQERQGLRIGAIEEVAYQMGFISEEQYKKITKPFRKSGYA
jgi:glucose-1-phosphate thymidylyltransferase